MFNSQIKRFSLALVLALLAGSLAIVAFAEGGAMFSLRPVTYNTELPASRSYLILELQPGTTTQSEVTVTNSGDGAGTVRLYPVDATTGRTSGTVFYMREDPRQSVGDWITLATTELTLDAGESRVVPVTIEVPAGTRAGEHVGGIIAENLIQREVGIETNAENSASFTARVQNRMAMAVQVNIAGPVVERMELVGVESGGAKGRQELLLTLRNSGTVMLKPQGTLVVKDGENQVVQNLSFQLDTVLPETEIDYPVFVEEQALAAGDYHAELTLQYGDEQSMQKQLEFKVTPDEVAQVFESREALAPPAAATVAEDVEKSSISPMIIAFVVLLAVLIGLVVMLVIQRRRLRQA